jgi:hypothetical protein
MNMRWQSRLIKIAVLLGIAALWSLCPWRVSGASPGNILWSPPMNISNTPQLSTHPAIVADGHGYVHVFWSEEVGGPPRGSGDLDGHGNTILYMRWDGASWTPPVDILFVPGEPIAEYAAVYVDNENRIHLVWTGLDNFYYSSAASWEAGSAHAWGKPVLIASNNARSRGESSVVVDANGNLHIVYATRGDGAGIYYIRSQDAGATWTFPSRLSQPLSMLELSYSSIKLMVDDAGYLHVVWQTNQQEGYGQAVYYARSINGGGQWSAPWQFGYRDPGDIFVEWPYLTARGDGEIHLIYIDGGTRGRLHRTSRDNGATWSEPRYIVAELEGINGYVFPVVDANSGMHLIANMRTHSDQRIGVYYAEWVENGWSQVVPLDNTSPGAMTAHYTAATVRLGNEIFIVYTQISVGEIWMLRGILQSVEALPALEIPQKKEAVLATPAADRSPAETEDTPARFQAGFDWDAQPAAPVSEWRAIALGLISSIVLVGSAAVLTRLRTGPKVRREKESDFV